MKDLRHRVSLSKRDSEEKTGTSSVLPGCSIATFRQASATGRQKNSCGVMPRESFLDQCKYRIHRARICSVGRFSDVAVRSRSAASRGSGSGITSQAGCGMWDPFLFLTTAGTKRTWRLCLWWLFPLSASHSCPSCSVVPGHPSDASRASAAYSSHNRELRHSYSYRCVLEGVDRLLVILNHPVQKLAIKGCTGESLRLFDRFTAFFRQRFRLTHAVLNHEVN